MIIAGNNAVAGGNQSEYRVQMAVRYKSGPTQNKIEQKLYLMKARIISIIQLLKGIR